MKPILRILVRRVARRLPRRWLRLWSRPTLAPAYCRALTSDIEAVFDLDQQSAWKDDAYWAMVLRKHAHILDKGLAACDFRPGRGLDHRAAAQEALGNIRGPAWRADPSVEWAEDRIRRHGADAPYATTPPPTPLTEGDAARLLGWLKARRSVRVLDARPVPIETLRMIATAANWVPSSCNKQALRVFAASTPELAAQCAATCKGATCFSQPLPCFLAFAVDLRAYVMPEEAWLPQVDAGLAAQNAALAAFGLGLSLTLLSWCQSSRADEARLRTLLGIPSFCRIVLNGALGYPAAAAEAPARMNIDHFLTVRKEPYAHPGD